MKKITFKQEWDNHTDINIIYINEEDFSVISSYSLEFLEDDENVMFKDFYIQPDYRGLKLSHIFLKEVISQYNNILIKVHKDNWFLKIYERYGFEFNKFDNGNCNYIWYKYF